MDNKIIPVSRTPVTGGGNLTSVKSSTEHTIGSPVSRSSSGIVVPNTSHSDGSAKQIIKQLENIIRAVQGPEKAFEISVHKDTNVIMVKVFDKNTGDLIREIPSEKLLDVAANMMELNGLLFDEKV